MKRTLELTIDCGDTTCASEPGKFCRFFGTRRMGTEFVCRLFPTTEDSFTPLEDKDGWVQRCEACLEVGFNS